MSRWGLRRRFAVSQDTEAEDQPGAAAVGTGRGGDRRLRGSGQAGDVAVLATEQWESSWPDICDQFGLHLLALADQLRASLDDLESDEDDPERLGRLYQVDHAVTRMRRASRDLRILAGRSEEELAGFTTSLLDVIRVAASAIERYTQVAVGRVTDLAVLGYAADDVASLMSALLDNATRYSPGPVEVSCRLLEDGGVLFRIEDSGIGMSPEQVTALNALLAGPVPEVDEHTGRHTGFPVVHRIARKHSIGVRLAARPLPGSGSVALVTLPPHLLCQVPVHEPSSRPAAATEAPPQPAPPPGTVPGLPRREAARPRPRRRPAEAGPPPTPEQQSAARRAFADDLSAFSLGAAGLHEAAAEAESPGDPQAASPGAAETAPQEDAAP